MVSGNPGKRGAEAAYWIVEILGGSPSRLYDSKRGLNSGLWGRVSTWQDLSTISRWERLPPPGKVPTSRVSARLGTTLLPLTLSHLQGM